MNGAAQNLRSHSCSLLRNCFCSYKTQENIAHNMFILITRGGERFFWLGLSFMHWRVADSGQSPYTKLPSPKPQSPESQPKPHLSTHIEPLKAPLAGSFKATVQICMRGRTGVYGLGFCGCKFGFRVGLWG